MKNCSKLLCVVAVLAAAGTASAAQIGLTSSSVIGGSSALGGAWDTGLLVGGVPWFLGGNITDGSKAESDGLTYWLAGSDSNEYLVIDLGATYKIDQIDLYNTHNRQFDDFSTLNFRVEASNSVVDIPSPFDDSRRPLDA